MRVTGPLKASLIFMVLCLFTVFSIGTLTDKNSIENRTSASWEDLISSLTSPDRVFEVLTLIFEDKFVFRGELIKISNFFDLNLFKANPVGGFVFGRDGWEFYAGDDNLEDQAGLKELTGPQIYRITRNIENSLSELNSQDLIASIFVVPNKASVYREYLPKRFMINGSMTRAEQILALSSNRPLFKQLAFEKDFYLLNKKAHGFEIYEKKGSHWNDLGAYVGYQILLKNLGLTPMPLDDFQIFDQPDYCPLSSTYMPTFNNFQPLNSPVLVSRNYGVSNVTVEPWMPSDIHSDVCGMGVSQSPFRVYETTNIEEPSLLIFGDSFSDKLLPFLFPHFSKITFVGLRYIDHALVKEIAPDVVVHQIAERFFSDVYSSPNQTSNNAENKNWQLSEFEGFQNYFRLTYADGIFESNLKKSLIVTAVNQNELDFLTSFNKTGLIASSPLQRAQVVLDFAPIQPKKLRLVIHGNFNKVLPSKSATTGSDSSILSVALNGQEVKVSFNENGIFVGGAVTNIPARQIDLRDITKIELSVLSNVATLYLNEEKHITWKSFASNAPSRVLFGDFSRKDPRVFSFSLSEIEITVGH